MTGKFERDGEKYDETVYDAEEAPQEVDSRKSRLSKFKRKANVALVTNVTKSPEQNLHKREVQYNWLQGSRIPLLLGSALAWWLGYIWLAVVLFVISVPMPWIAVVVGNAHGEARDPRAPIVYKPQAQRDYFNHQLDAGNAQALPPGALTDEDGKAIDLIREQYRFAERPARPTPPQSDDDSGIEYKNSRGMFS